MKPEFKVDKKHREAEGKWSLSPNHDLIFTLRKSTTAAKTERITLKTELIQAKANTLVFLLATRGKTNTQRLQRLELKGKWRADKHNRLQFLVKRLRNRTDALTFQGAWAVKRNSLIYTYRKESLKTKQKSTRTLRFKGYWEINKPHRLTYILDTRNDSAFEFKVYLETPNLIGKRGVIKYRVGIGVKGNPLFKARTVSLYGVWKFHRKTGLSLVVDYGGGRVKAIGFGAFVRIKKKGKVALSLRNRAGKDLGLEVTFTRRF